MCYSVKPSKHENDLVERIVAFEQGMLQQDEVIDLFQDLVNSGIICHLQGSYQRTAMEMLRAGVISQPR